MNEREALLANVLRVPGDDTARLVMADWLQENGEPERAEFIRVQMELWRRRDEYESFDLIERTPSYKKLEARQWELLGGSEFSWAAPLGDIGFQANSTWVPECEWEFSRGFVGSVTCAAVTWFRHSHEAIANHPITEVRLTTRPRIGVGGPGWVPNSVFLEDGGFCLTVAELPSELRRDLSAADIPAVLRCRWRRITFSIDATA